jgi:hypothetical protein
MDLGTIFARKQNYAAAIAVFCRAMDLDPAQPHAHMLGTHPVSSTSYVSSVGTVSKLKAYGNNPADNPFIPGGVIPGYIIIKPDFPECIDDFGFLWFEDEYVIDDASRWIVAANAANALVTQTQAVGTLGR